jgi:hypothetical protein
MSKKENILLRSGAMRRCLYVAAVALNPCVAGVDVDGVLWALSLVCPHSSYL